MTTPKKILSVTVAVLFVAAAAGSMASAQQAITKKPTAEEWAALAKLPDFNGVWERGGGGGRGGAAAPAGQRGAAAPAGRGAGGRGGGIQLTPEYEAKRAAYKAPEDSETANCLPPGMPGIMTQPYPMEFLLTPGKVTIVIEAYTQVRHIYTDGRKLPEDPDPKFFGTSVGRWEGDTLVVESVGFAPHLTLTGGVPHSGKMKIVERFRLADPENMSIETTITDPVALLAPITSNANLRRHREWTITEYICEENNRNAVDSTGKSIINLTLPGTR
jgi:hypothetical protein